MPKQLGAVISGTGSQVPTRVVPNSEFSETLETTDHWIRTRTGIVERRFAGPGESSATLGITASRQALASAKLKGSDLDLIICATVTPDTLCPSNACRIQSALGCRPITAFDISAACSGFLYALGTAETFIAAGRARHALVVGSEVLSRTLDRRDRNSSILFGDGAGAVVLSAVRDSSVGIRKVRLYSDGCRGELIQVPSPVTAMAPPLANPLDACDTTPLAAVRLNGREVFKFAVYRMIEIMEQAERDCRELGIPSIDLLVPHQVNQRIIDAALSAKDFPIEKVMVNLDRYGNTAAASVPIALDEALRSGRTSPGHTILLAAFGGGLTWGSALVTL